MYRRVMEFGGIWYKIGREKDAGNFGRRRFRDILILIVGLIALGISDAVSVYLTEQKTLDMAAAAIKRTSLKLGMIPADGIGKEVLPVSQVSSWFQLSLHPDPANPTNVRHGSHRCKL